MYLQGWNFFRVLRQRVRGLLYLWVVFKLFVSSCLWCSASLILTHVAFNNLSLSTEPGQIKYLHWNNCWLQDSNPGLQVDCCNYSRPLQQPHVFVYTAPPRLLTCFDLTVAWKLSCVLKPSPDFFLVFIIERNHCHFRRASSRKLLKGLLCTRVPLSFILRTLLTLASSSWNPPIWSVIFLGQ